MTRVFWYTDAAPICPGLFKQDWPVPRIIGSFWPPGWGVVLASQQVVQTKGVDTVEAFWALGLRRNWRGSLSHGGSPSHHGLKLKWLNDLDDNWGYSHFWKPPYRALCSLMWPTGYLYRLVGEMTIHQHPPFQVVASLVYDKMEISTEDPNMPWLSLVLQRDENWNTLWMRSVKGLGSEITFLSWKLWNLPRGGCLKMGNTHECGDFSQLSLCQDWCGSHFTCCTLDGDVLLCERWCLYQEQRWANLFVGLVYFE